MKTSDKILIISKALLAAQREIGAAKKGSTNPFFKSSYASLGDVMEACKDALNKNGIAVLQPIIDDSVETVLLHESGEWIGSSMKIVVSKPNDPQALGSAISYTKRYSLQAMLFIPSEDDDGNEATVKSPTAIAKPTTTAVYDDPYGIGPDLDPRHEDIPLRGESICPIHQVEMKLYERGSAHWYSHQTNGTWCNPYKKS